MAGLIGLSCLPLFAFATDPLHGALRSEPIATSTDANARAAKSTPQDPALGHAPGHPRIRAGEKLKLQEILDRDGVLLLEPDTDYRSGGLARITLSDGQRIAGGWNTRVPQIVVPGGVSRITIDGVNGDGFPGADVLFSGGGGANDDCVIIGGLGTSGANLSIVFAPGAMITNLHVAYFGAARADFSRFGYMRNSTFEAGALYNGGPRLVFRGNDRTPSFGNAYLAVASTTPQGSALWERFGDIWAVGFDCESWNQQAHAADADCFAFSELRAVRGAGPTGGTAYAGSGALARFQHVDAVSLAWPIGHGGKAGREDIRFEAVKTSVLLQGAEDSRYGYSGAPEGAVRARLLFPFGGQSNTHSDWNGQSIDGANPSALEASVSALAAPSLQAMSRRKPTLRGINDLLGPSWKSTLGGQPDSSRFLQHLIDRDHVARVPPGVYFLDEPLRIGSASVVEGLIGSGEDEVYLVAKGSFPVIEGRGEFGPPKYPDPVGLHLVLEGLTIYGGSYGLYLSGDLKNLGTNAQVNWSRFAHLRFLKQSLAGVRIAHIYGFDNNVWYETTFANTVDAISGEGRGTGPGMTYADKQYLIQCDFVDLSGAAWAWESTRGSGGNSVLDSYFKNVGSVSRTRSATGNTWINDVFENITGHFGIDLVDSGGTTATYMLIQFDCLWKGHGPDVVTKTGSSLIGTLFIGTEFAQDRGTLVDSGSPQAILLWNSTLKDTVKLGEPTEAVLIDAMALPGKPMQVELIHHGIHRRVYAPSPGGEIDGAPESKSREH